MKLKLLFFYFLLFTFNFLLVATATVRYVSKTGSATPPYTTWATASDSIQKCINICQNGDTVYVANGVYKESLVIDSIITLLGGSMDSCIIDGRELNNVTIRFRNIGSIQGFNIIGKGITDVNYKGIICQYAEVKDCKISNCYDGIFLAKSSQTIRNVIMDNVITGVYTFCMSDTCQPKLYNSVLIIHKNGDAAWLSYDGGQPTLLNNILVTNGWNTAGGSAAFGIQFAFTSHKKILLKNNFSSGFFMNNMWNRQTDSAVITNNVFVEQGEKNSNAAILQGVKSNNKIRNNIFMKNDITIDALSQPDMNFNLFWENNNIINSPYQLGEHDIIANPMIVKDTVGYSLKADYHLQKFSPAIDAGDPEIIDINGSRSDIGLYGGPLGTSYKYLDLPPSSPANFIAAYDTSFKRVIISWRMNTEHDFMKYIIYRSDNPNFIPDSTNKYAETEIAFFTDTSLTGYNKLYYRITAVDSQLNESISGQLIAVTITDVLVDYFEVITDYTLYQNYPNPFNSTTRINYGIKERGYVKLILYTLSGEQVMVIVNGEREAGFYETSINIDYLSSGIYLYRIEVIGKNKMPVFMDMKKMVLAK